MGARNQRTRRPWKPTPSGDGRRGAAQASGSAGFAAVDALVGLMIIATSLILSFRAMSTAEMLAAGAMETRRATALMQFLVEGSSETPGSAQGQDGAFRWRLEVTASTETDGVRGLRLCRRSVVAQSRTSARTYALSAVRTCRLKEGA